jgi:hypothetical protein
VLKAGVPAGPTTLPEVTLSRVAGTWRRTLAVGEETVTVVLTVQPDGVYSLVSTLNKGEPTKVAGRVEIDRGRACLRAEGADREGGSLILSADGKTLRIVSPDGGPAVLTLTRQ